VSRQELTYVSSTCRSRRSRTRSQKNLRASFGPPNGKLTEKPATLAYGLEEAPPALVVWISAVQHVGVFAIFLIYPLIVVRETNLATDEIVNILQLGLLVLAIGTVLQALPNGPVGSRLLAPSIFTGIYLVPSLLAVKVGGLPLVWGMTIFAGVFEIALSRIWSHLRPFVPPESAGLVVFLVGSTIGLAAFRVLLDNDTSGSLTAADSATAGTALAVMTALNIWNRGLPKLFCILIGMVVGYLMSAAIGLLTFEDVSHALNRPWLAFPTLRHISFAFDWSMVVPFAVSGLAAAMNSTAVLTTYQRLTDAEWVRPDMISIGGGMLGDGLATVVSGLLGTYGVTVSSANVGLVAATGVASRVIAFAAATILIVASLLPALIGLLTIMPRPVMAAAMLFTAVFIMIGGVQIISTRVLDGRRTLVIGMGMLSIFAASVNPLAFANTPKWAQPLVTSPLVMATLVALLLNLLFRIGIRRNFETCVGPHNPDVKNVTNLIERNGGVWGARRDVITRVEIAVQQTIDAIIGFCQPMGLINLDISFDEFKIEATITYDGTALDFPALSPTEDEIIETEEGARQLAGFLIRRYADRMHAISKDGRVAVVLLFDH
jgi:NCS2 family nucleobase:cation symporter-2